VYLLIGYLLVDYPLSTHWLWLVLCLKCKMLQVTKFNKCSVPTAGPLPFRPITPPAAHSVGVAQWGKLHKCMTNECVECSTSTTFAQVAYHRCYCVALTHTPPLTAGEGVKGVFGPPWFNMGSQGEFFPAVGTIEIKRLMRG